MDGMDRWAGVGRKRIRQSVRMCLLPGGRGDQASLQCPPHGCFEGPCEHMIIQRALLQCALQEGTSQSFY